MTNKLREPINSITDLAGAFALFYCINCHVGKSCT